MTTLRWLSAMLIVSLFATSPARAGDDLWLGAKAGTLGLGLEATWRPVPYLDFRAGLNRYNFNHDGYEAGIDYDGDVDLGTYFVTANLRAPLTPFRMTAGIFSNGNEVSLTSREADAIMVGGGVFPGDQVGTLNAAVEFDGMAPYAGIGFDLRIANTVGMSIDLGVLWQGEPAVDLAATGPISDDPLFQAELEAERRDLESELEHYKLFPVASIGLNWNF